MSSMSLFAPPTQLGPLNCPGCAHLRPQPDCAACGKPAAVALLSGEHTMSLCLSCYALVKQIRAEAAPRSAAQAQRPKRARAQKATA